MRKYVDEFIDFGPGQPYYPSNLHLSYYQPLKQQLSILREDIFQVSYGNNSLNYIIDVGWYGRSFSLTGKFVVYLIKNSDWQIPILRISCKSVKKLVPAVSICLNRIKTETENFSLLSLL